MDDDELLDLLEKTSILTCDAKQGQGTAFVIAKGIAATAGHCVASWKDGQDYKVRVGGSHTNREVSARVLRRGTEKDVALLVLEGCDDIAPLPVRESLRAGSRWLGFGYPSAASNRDDGVVGMPVGGYIRCANWRNEKGRTRILCSSDEAAAGQGTSMGGYSGTAVTVDGAIVGMLVKQVGDPTDRSRVAYGFLQACLMADIIALLPPDTQVNKAHAPRRQKMKVHAPATPDRIPKLLAWCDRDAVTAAVKDWYNGPGAALPGLLCLAGHSDHRPGLLLERVRDELGKKPCSLPVGHRPINGDHKFESGAAFRTAMLASLQVTSVNDVLHCHEYEKGAKLVLLSATCECGSLDAGQIAKILNSAARGMGELNEAGRSLLVVVTLLFGDDDRTWLEKLRGRIPTRQKVQDALIAIRGRADAELAVRLIREPIELTDYYTRNHFDEWPGKDPCVEEGLGATLAMLDNAVISTWFKNDRCPPGQLNRLLTEFHIRHMRHREST